MRVETKKELQDMIEVTYLAGKDLYDLELNGVNLHGVNFKGLRLYTCKFNDCSLSKANFNCCELRWCIFDNCKMAGTRFHLCSYLATQFKGIAFSKEAFLNTRVNDVIFTRCIFLEVFPIDEATYRLCTIKNINRKGIYRPWESYSSHQERRTYKCRV